MVMTIMKLDYFVINGDNRSLTAAGLSTVPPHFGSSASMVFIIPVSIQQ